MKMFKVLKEIYEQIHIKFICAFSGNRAEYHPNPPDEYNEYVINGVKYKVSSAFNPKEEKTFSDRISNYIGSAFAHLTLVPIEDKIETEYVTTAGKED